MVPERKHFSCQPARNCEFGLSVYPLVLPVDIAAVGFPVGVIVESSRIILRYLEKPLSP
jgi:hypothetical protein